MATSIQLRRDTSENWTLVNPILLQGEIGVELDTKKFKFGDGTTAWNSLDYVDLGASSFEQLSGSPYDNSALAEALNEKASTGALETEILNRTNADNAIISSKQNKLTSANAGNDITITEVGGIVKINSTAQGVAVHNELTGRSTENAHPMSAISGLVDALDGKATTGDISDAISAHNTSDISHQDIRQEVDGKQDTINDLEQIRDGAEAGATALQSSDIINSTSSTATDKPLAASVGKDLQDQIINIERRTKYLTDWNSAIGDATTNPPYSPYQFTTGDFFVVSVVASEGGTNYKPYGTSYTIGQPHSTVVETETVSVDDQYVFDGTSWNLRKSTPGIAGSFATLSGSPYDNSNLAAALNGKQGSLDNTQLSAVNSGITSTKVGQYDSHIANTSIHVTSTDKTNWNSKQDQLVSGTNIKTINSQSIVGSGNLAVNAGVLIEL